MVIHARLVSYLAAKQLIYRYAEMLARDVPQRNIKRAYARHYRGAAEVSGAVHRLPVMLDEKRVLPNKVRSEFQPNRGLRRFIVSPRARLAIAGNSLVRMHLHEQIPVHGIGFNRCYFHNVSSQN